MSTAESPARPLPVEEATDNLLLAALRVLASRVAPELADAAAEAEYASDMLAHAARELTRATDALPAERRPVAWDRKAAS